MRRLAPVLLLTAFLPTCGGDDVPAKDWSNSPMMERAVDYCLKLAACSPDVDLLTTARCVDTMVDLSAFSNQVPTRRELNELLVLRDCYNAAKSCSQVRECVGIPSGNDLDECDLDNAANSCANRMGVSTLRRCVPSPNGEGGVWLEIDCTKYGLVCGFNDDNINLCVSDTCTVLEDPPTCEESTGDIEICGGVDPITGQSVGAIINEYQCSYLGMGCDLGPGDDPNDPLDDQPQCIGSGDECDPAQVGFACEGSVLSLCQPNVDPTTGNMASWDCAAGVIHHECNAGLGVCAKSASDCDPTTDRGLCDGPNLTVCVDGTPYTTDCRLHGIGDCGADTNGNFTCID
jgi:hypothetical protein